MTQKTKSDLIKDILAAGATKAEYVGDCLLINGNFLDLKSVLPKAQCAVTDPPYLVSKGGFAANLKLQGGFGGWMKDYGNNGDIVQCDLSFSDWCKPVFELLDDRSQAYFMTNGNNLSSMQTELEKAGFKLHTILVWDKRSALPNKYYQNITEFCLFVYKGKASTINDPSSKNLISIFQRDETKHPTEKPVSLMSYWIENSTNENDIVLDSFMGSGTTGVASIQLGRRFIGVELDSNFYEVAVERCKKAINEPLLFNQSRGLKLENLDMFEKK